MAVWPKKRRLNRILQTHQHVDIIFGTHNIHRLPYILKEAYLSKEMVVEVWSKEGDIIENLPKLEEVILKLGSTLCMAVTNSVHIALCHTLVVKKEVVDLKILF